MGYQTERERFIIQLTLETHGHCDNPESIYFCLIHILRAAQVLQRFAVTECNGETSESEARRAAAAERRLKDAVAALKLPGYRVGGDPRGYVVAVFLPSGAHNTWGGKEAGWGIPTK